MLSFVGSVTLGIIVLIVILSIFGKNGKGPLSRLFNIGKGKADRAIEEMEKGDPDALFRMAIEEAQEALVEIDSSCHELKGLEFEERGKVAQLEGEKYDLEKMLNVALEQSEEELGAEIISKMEILDEQVETHKEQIKLYKEQAEEMQSIRNSKKSELEELKVEQKTANSIQTASSVVEKIRQRQEGLANDAVSKGLENARSGIASKKASLKANKEIKSNSLESKMEDLKRKGAQSASKDKFKEMLANKNKGE